MPRTVVTSRETALPWLQDPLGAHQQWRASLSWTRGAKATDAYADGDGTSGYTEHSNKLYQSFWGKFCHWMAGRSLKLDQVKQHHVEAFLETLRGRDGKAPASVRTMRTYLAEINRVYAHLQERGIVRGNPAMVVLEAKRMKPATQLQTDPPLPPSGPVFLAAYEKVAAAMYREEIAQSPDAWTPARNLALRLVVAECGLKLAEVCKLIPRNITLYENGKVEILTPGHRRVRARTVEGGPRLAKAVKQWLKMRSELKVVQLKRAQDEGGRKSNRLFLGQAGVMKRDLGNLVIKDKHACSPVAPDLAERIVTACVKRTLEQLGHQAASYGPQFVRNAYAARLIARKNSDDYVSGQLGMATNFTVRAIREKLGQAAA